MSTTSEGMAKALDAAKIVPDELAGAHDRATSNEHDVEPAPDEGNERG